MFRSLMSTALLLSACGPTVPSADDDDATVESDNVLPDPVGWFAMVSQYSYTAHPGEGLDVWRIAYGAGLPFNGRLNSLSWSVRFFRNDGLASEGDLITCQSLVSASWDGADEPAGATGSVTTSPPGSELGCVGGDRPDQTELWLADLDEHLRTFWVVPVGEATDGWPSLCPEGACTFGEFRALADDGDSGRVVTHGVLGEPSPLLPELDDLEGFGMFGYITQAVSR